MYYFNFLYFESRELTRGTLKPFSFLVLMSLKIGFQKITLKHKSRVQTQPLNLSIIRAQKYRRKLILASDYSLECFEHVTHHVHIIHEIVKSEYNKRF